MDPKTLAQPMIGVATLLAIWVIYATAVAILFSLPLGRRTRRHSVLIAADPRTVWDTYFFHIGRCDYRPYMRYLSCDILAENPLTVRIAIQSDLSSEPSNAVLTYDVFEPYTRYRLTTESGVIEEGELQPSPAGTWLRTATTAPARGLLLPWAIRRRVEKSYHALRDVCEGGPPAAPRGALPAPRRWERWAVAGGILGLLTIVAAQLQGAPLFAAIPLVVVAGRLVLIRWIRFTARLLG